MRVRERHLILEPTTDFTPRTRRVFDYWTKLRDSGKPPKRSDFDPCELKSDLPNLMLLQVMSEPRDFRYRLIGTAVDHFTGIGRTGKLVSEVVGRGSNLWRSLCRVVDTGRPSTLSAPYEGPHQDYVATAQVALPMLGTAGAVDFILIGIDYLRQSQH